jgi:hypothetical protein
MSDLTIYVEGIGLLGPGLSGWEASRPLLCGAVPLVLAPTQLPVAVALPAAERRRVGTSVKLSMAIGFEAVQQAGADASQIATVFSSTGGDCDNCHAILETLASDDRQISPTRFHNSVHNAPSGYWGIATGCQAPSTSLCALDATFGVALLEAAAQALTSRTRCMMLAYDTSYPEPLYTLRPIPYPVGVAMLLSPERSAATFARLSVMLGEEPLSECADPLMESLRRSVPAARALPLLQLLAQEACGRVVVDYLERLSLTVEVGK